MLVSGRVYTSQPEIKGGYFGKKTLKNEATTLLDAAKLLLVSGVVYFLIP